MIFREDSMESERIGALLPDKYKIRKSGILDEVWRILRLERYTPICARKLFERIYLKDRLQLGLQRAAFSKDRGDLSPWANGAACFQRGDGVA